MTDTTDSTENTEETAAAVEETGPNVNDMSDDELKAVALPMWDDLIMYSNEGKYGMFIKKFSQGLLKGLNEVEVGKQFARSELTRNLNTEYDFLGFIRRGEHVTCLFRMTSTKKEGEYVGRLVLGYEEGVIKIFAAAIF